ncbi:mucin-5AC-like [Daphnia pulex]|uniref:mucin-5AC-like n=1 Tax=Daphnia pulex TaxID=6669 RepID=UPI001EE15369|nr:mucin-5AC-like [Daphnia pulex]
MRSSLIFLLSAFLVTSHQFYLQRPIVPLLWFPSPYLPHRFINNYHLIDEIPFHRHLNPPRTSIYFQNENPNWTTATNNLNNTEGFPDTQSRIRDFNHPLNDNHSRRFFLSGFNSGNNNNPFFRTFTTTSTSTTFLTDFSTATSTSFAVSTKTSIITSTSFLFSTSTATTTNTATLTLTSVIKCVPSFQLSAVPITCGWKKRAIDEDDEEHQQFLVSPTETLKLMPTALPTPTGELASPVGQLTSSKDENEMSNEEQSTRRSKRFFFNRFQFSTLLMFENSTTTSVSTSVINSIIVIPTTTVTTSVSTLTAFTTSTYSSYVFYNTTSTQTVNLILPAPTVQCKALSQAAGDIVCVACIPPGYVVCAASG